jgi:hypothetical protein
MNAQRAIQVIFFCLCIQFVGASPTAFGQFAGNQSQADVRDGIATGRESRSLDDQPKVGPVILREGTQVGPIRGRFVLRAQRWAFLPDSAGDRAARFSRLGDDSELRSSTPPKPASILQRKSGPVGISANASGTQTKEIVSSFVNDSVGQANRSTRPPQSLYSGIFQQMIVLENLMLGRIASAIEQDPDDNTWTITARVTEFKDENRMLLITAHRAPR